MAARSCLTMDAPWQNEQFLRMERCNFNHHKLENLRTDYIAPAVFGGRRGSKALSGPVKRRFFLLLNPIKYGIISFAIN